MEVRAIDDWRLLRLFDGTGDFSLTNTHNKIIRGVRVTFEGVVDGQRWSEGVTPASVITHPGEVGRYETVTFSISHAHTVDSVTVEWAGLLGRKRWTTTRDANGRQL